ncbi:PilW family protein [Pseudomarimonas arenosa]|uniref:PilW family protein n=1 Tax=Pseudomarimonas arenosa TaxID=2774145 RepID=A0AAW3ZUA5_9GAMM|nr:PilW family protein [Pseudomarimonas arenosa]MBD8528044.1 PilW family protein [Pseudomarimonas arenosa]
MKITTLTARKQHGVSLIELLIALTLGTILVLGLTQVFSGVRSSFGASEGLSRVQENARFAMDFMRHDVRMAGYLGCFNEFRLVDAVDRGLWNHTADFGIAPRNSLAEHDTAPYTLQLHRPIEVYDYVQSGGTSPGNTYGITLPASPGGIGNANDFQPVLPTVLTATANNLGTNGLLNGDVGDPVPGSDILVLRSLSATSNPVPGADGIQISGILSGTDIADFPPWRIFGVTNCSQTSLFQISSTSSPAAAVADGSNLNREPWTYDNEIIYGGGVAVHEYQFFLYYVGRTLEGPPSLYRRRIRQNPGVAAEGDDFSDAEELVPGVEMMQILLGVDNQPFPVDDVVDQFVSASQLFGATPPNTQAFFNLQRSIKSVRISLLVRSPDRIPGVVDPIQPTRVVGDVIVSPPLDGRLRHVYDATINIRNRNRN